MLRELFDGTCRVIPVHIEWKMLDLANDKTRRLPLRDLHPASWLFARVQFFNRSVLCGGTHFSQTSFVGHCFGRRNRF